MKSYQINPVSTTQLVSIAAKIDRKTKPPASLGVLEDIALQIGSIQGTDAPEIRRPTMVVFAGDHGVAAEGVSPYPRAVTGQLVRNILRGGAAVSVFTRQNGLGLVVVDAGVDADLAIEFAGGAPDKNTLFIDAKIARGTRNFLYEDAFGSADLDECFRRAEGIVDGLFRDGCNFISFGEMGIGNTSSASMLQTLLTNVPLARCTGRGGGLDDQGLARKIEILERARRRFKGPITPDRVLCGFGGFEVAMLTGAMLAAAERGMVILVDGYTTTAALLVAFFIGTDILDYCIFSHQSDERGHRALLDFLQAVPLLRLHLKLGEGAGAALAFPLVCSAVRFLGEMASFESVGFMGLENGTAAGEA